MSATHPFAPEHRAFWQDMANTCDAQRPSPGKAVTVVRGRKHCGKTGLVVQHMVSRFDNPFRYGSPQQHQMTVIQGRSGYVILVRPDDGQEFWVRADYVRVAGAPEETWCSAHQEPSIASGKCYLCGQPNEVSP